MASDWVDNHDVKGPAREYVLQIETVRVSRRDGYNYLMIYFDLVGTGWEVCRWLGMN